MQLILLQRQQGSVSKFFHDTYAFISYYDLGLFLTSAVFLCAGAGAGASCCLLVLSYYFFLSALSDLRMMTTRQRKLVSLRQL